MKINLTATSKEMDVCDFLRINPDTKAVVETILERYAYDVGAYPFPTTLVNACGVLADHIEAMGLAANSIIGGDDTIENRTKLNEEAVIVASIMIAFLENIGNFKPTGR